LFYDLVGCLEIDQVKLKNQYTTLAALSGCLLSFNGAAFDETSTSETLIVTAELEDSNVLELANSVSVIDAEIIQARNAQQLSDILNLAPNVNFATGASRGRFIQIRGIGERSEFKEPVNYSVGVVLDGIDLTGISTAASTLDIQQIEILRGPQGTLYGANGLAGLINLVSNSPTDRFYSKLSASIESFGGQELSGVVSGPLSENISYRFALKRYVSDGFMKNNFLDRNDTNNIDELSLRGKLEAPLNQDVEMTTSVFLADIDNGYDAFSLDSNRQTLSDQPGFDRQKTRAIAIDLDWDINQSLWLESVLSFADSDLDYAYDEDWSHTGICDGTPCDSELAGFDWWYSSFDQYQRDNNNISLDLKLHSNNSENSVGDNENPSWVAGFYFREQQIDLTRQYTYQNEDFTSQFDTNNIALYGQFTSPLSDNIDLISGLRFERRSSDYTDNDGSIFSPAENLWGGKLAIEYQYDTSRMIYGLISRGYKNGGINSDANIANENRIFNTEYQWNYEAGIKGLWLEDSLTLQTAIFYQDRRDIQTKDNLVRSIDSGLLVQQNGICPCSFTGLITNSSEGSSSGIEIESSWQTNENLKLYATLGLLNAEFDLFPSFNHIDADQETIPPVPVDMSGRDVAHAPNHQLVLGGIYYFSDHLSFNPELESKDSFYFSDQHDVKSGSYQLLNLRLIYQPTDWRLSLYINNAFDKNIQTRGFGSFGNDPRNFYARGEYFQFGTPRVIGLSFTHEFE